MVYAAERLLSFRECGILLHATQRLHTGPVPDKNSGYESQASLPGWQHFICVVTILLGELSFSCMTPLRKDS